MNAGEIFTLPPNTVHNAQHSTNDTHTRHKERRGESAACLQLKQIYRERCLNRSADLEPLLPWQRETEQERAGEGHVAAPSHHRDNNTAHSHQGDDNTGCSRVINGSTENKRNPGQVLPQALGAGFAGPARPEDQTIAELETRKKK